MSKSNTNIWSKLIKFCWICFFAGIGFLVLYIYLVSIDFLNLFGPMPSLEALENPKKDQASIVYTSDGVELGKYFRENRNPVEYKNISPNLINALQATEDYRFSEHSGIDLTGLIRVAFKSLILQQHSGGGSTISQQLAKNLFNTRGKNFKGTIENKKLNVLFVKTKEWITAVRLERSYTKQEIITMYLNTVDFGSNAYGIKTAAATFFSTTPDSLTVPQAAVLVGLLKAPTLYSPILNPENSVERRNVVIDQMNKYSFLTDEQADSIKAKPIELKYVVENHNTGLATYFRSVITDYLMKWSEEHNVDLYTDGLRIYTTIDSRMQKHAEMAVEKHMKDEQKTFNWQWKNMTPWRDEELKEIPNFIETSIKRTERYHVLKSTYGDDSIAIWKVLRTPYKMRIFTWKGEKDTIFSPLDSLRYYKRFLHAGLLSVEPQTGHIKAWVGGINHKYFKYDHVKQGARQPGSTFKPIVYATAIDHGYSPCYEVIDAPVTFETGDTNKTWSPKNSDGVFTNKPFTLRKAMANSINSVTARMIKEVTPQHVVDMAHRLGIESPLEAVPALCLGVNDVTIYEMVGAYSTFVNEGVWIQPTFITRIEDKNGNILEQIIPKTREALNEESAYLMVHMLRGATEERGGTALGLNKFKLLGIGAEIGGKTGTTQNYSDGWFIGLVSKLTTGVWVGGEDRCIHLRGFEYAQGARTAMPIWAYFMQAVFEDPELDFKKERFPRPAKRLSIEIDCNKYDQKETNSQDSTFLHKVKQDLPDGY
ncbi:MAG TPA: transglycosylase domain-containing protein [Cytophagaceae bacterium]|nr:transglycosylase domain-containing protein [Cytophagaceae bacterium]